MEGRRTGVEEYVLGLLKALFANDSKNEYVLFFNSWKNPRFDFALFEQFVNVRLVRTRIPNKLLNFLFWYFDWPKIDRLVGGCEVVFFPNLSFGAVSSGVRVVSTIHDLSFERYPGCFSWKRRWWHLFINPRKFCQKSDCVMVVSHSTKDDLVEKYGLTEKKLCLVSSGVADDFCLLNRNDEKFLQIKEKYHLPYRFVLYLGTIEPRKNIVGIIRAFDQLQTVAKKEGNEFLLGCCLVIAGSSGWLDELVWEAWQKSKHRDKIIFPGFIAAEDKAYVYNLAALFVYPSFFEGFGFPPLEAMRCGIPLIVANNSSLPEICQAGAILVDPDKSEELFFAMRELLSDRTLKEQLSVTGKEIATEFNWKKTAQGVLRILNA